MSRRHLLVTVAAVALVAIALGSVVGVRLGDGSAPSPGASGSPASPGHAAGTAATDAPPGSASEGTEPRSGTKHRGSEPAPSATSTTSAPASEPSAPSEVDDAGTDAGGALGAPDAAGPTDGHALPDLPSAARPPWADDPPDEPSAALGRLVAGYPGRLLPVVPRGAVVSSSVAPSASRVQVGLVARHPSGPASVLRFYRAALSVSGFAERPVRAVGGATAAAFRRGPDRVVVTVDPGQARTYSVYATLAVDRG